MSHLTATSTGRTAASTGQRPTREVFRFVADEIRQVGVHLLGRGPYETMLYWETADQDPSLDDSMLEWAAIWKPLPKVVFSATLPAVQGHARLASGGLAEEIERLRAEPAEGDIALGGATLAAEAAALGLIDEYRARVYPVPVGGGIPFFPQRERRADLELVETPAPSARESSTSATAHARRLVREPRKSEPASGLTPNHPAQFSQRSSRRPGYVAGYGNSLIHPAVWSVDRPSMAPQPGANRSNCCHAGLWFLACL